MLLEETIQDNNKNLTNTAIIKTVAFFDLFDYPLTTWEIHKFLPTGRQAVNSEGENSFESILKNLENDELSSKISQKEGFYFLAGREGLIRVRKDRYNFTDRKMKRALRVAKLFKIIPWIKMIAVGNIIGSHNLKDDGDIDFFIITQKDRIWLTRFFCVFIIKLLGLRPKKEKTRDTICLSFFVSEEALNLERFLLPDDVYFIHWLAGLVPIFDSGGVYEKFVGKNEWLKKQLPNWQPTRINLRRDAGNAWPKFYHDVIDLIFSWSESFLKKLQLKLMPADMKELMNKDTRVVMNDQILKMHLNDRREEYKKRFEVKLSGLSPY